jgi:hypothetical protein
MDGPIVSVLTRSALRCAGWVAAAWVAGSLRGGAAENAPATSLVWTLDNVKLVGRHAPLVLGTPQVTAGEPGIRFNGQNDGLILPVNPLAGLPAFTIEALIQPAADGAPAQRFLHIEDERGNRALMEIRLSADGRWCLDTFLLCGNSRLSLIDPARLHPAGRWHWVALRCDGRRMDHFVDGVKEGEGAVVFTPFTAGRMSLGVRLNQAFWFKGAIREVRLHPVALAAERLQRLP